MCVLSSSPRYYFRESCSQKAVLAFKFFSSYLVPDLVVLKSVISNVCILARNHKVSCIIASWFCKWNGEVQSVRFLLLPLSSKHRQIRLL